jgi:CheY-like chemotaxis protein
MCSAYDSKDNIERAKQCGMVDILSKPVNITKLKLILKEMVK